MRRAWIESTVLALAAILLASACGDTEESDAPTLIDTLTPTAESTASPTVSPSFGSTPPVQSPVAAPWLQRSRQPAPLDATAVNIQGIAAWTIVNPETGEYRPPTGGLLAPDVLAGSRYGIVTSPTGLAVLDVVNKTVTEIGPGWTGVVSPDGRWVAFIPMVEGPSLAVVDVNSGEQFDLGEMGKPVNLAWSADGRLAMVKGNTLYLAQAPDWRPEMIGPFYGTPEWSPDGRWLAYVQSGEVRVASPDLSEVRTLAKAPSWVGYSTGGSGLAWSSDADRLAYGTRDGIFVVSIEAGEVINVSPVGVAGSLPFPVWAPIWSPDDSAIAFFALDDGKEVRGIVVAGADGSGAYQLTEGFASVIGWTAEGIVAYILSFP